MICDKCFKICDKYATIFDNRGGYKSLGQYLTGSELNKI